MEQVFSWVGAEDNQYDFAADLTLEPITLRIALRSDRPDLPAPGLVVTACCHEIAGQADCVPLNATLSVSKATAEADRWRKEADKAKKEAEQARIRGDLAQAKNADAKAEDAEARAKDAETRTDVRVELPAVPVHVLADKEIKREVDDRFIVTLSPTGGCDIPVCAVEVRRTHCRVGSALLQYNDETQGGDAHQKAIRSQRRAALRWWGWNRCEEILGLKRITLGRSGSDVTVYRPRLSPPPITDPLIVGEPPLPVWEHSWGTTLLVKTSKAQGQSDEWDRYRHLVADRLQPFMARCDELINAQPVGDDVPQERLATMIGTFLGSDFLRTESLEAVVRAAESPERIESIVGQVFRTLGPWYAGSERAPLWRWAKMFSLPTDAAPKSHDRIKLFPFRRDGRLQAMDLWDDTKADKLEPQEGTREYFTRPLSWDVPFIKAEHLKDHVVGLKKTPVDPPPEDHVDEWVGGKQFGLLRRLLKNVNLRYSLIHGDLHGGNVLVDVDNVWLLDWGRVAVGPTLFDFTKMEVYLRLNCLKPTASAESVDQPAACFEALLLDHFLATEGSLEPAAELAESLGTSPQRLLAVARGINAIRQAALPYGGERPDRLEYLTVLYLTVFQTLTYANAAEAVQFRMLMALCWLLEDTLSRMMGGEPYKREQAPVEAEHLLRPQWLAAPGAPQRVLYAMDRPDGARALPALAGTRGVLQGEWHHLDVFDHTLLVLAYMEELLAQPVAAMLDPLSLDNRVRETLARQGIRLLPFLETVSETATPVADWVKDLAQQIEEPLTAYLNRDGSLQNLVKWATLLHDVGKTGTRLLNTGKGPKVQFIGHEAYGAQLVRGFLQRRFPDEKDQTASPECLFIENLILFHHRHHTYHDEDHYGNPNRWGRLKDAAEAGRVDERERTDLKLVYDQKATGAIRDFPWLILLGFADMLACRGAGRKTPIQRAAEIDIALLAVFFRAPVILHRQTMETHLKDALTGLGESVGLRGKEIALMNGRLSERFFAETCPPGATAAPGGIPTADDVRRWAEEYATGRTSHDPPRAAG